MLRRFVTTLAVTWLALPAAATATGFADVARALDDADWTKARQLATEADEAAQHGDFYAAYVQARSFGDQGNCGAAIEIYNALLEAQPYFLPAVEQSFICASQLGDETLAVRNLDRALAILPPGSQRDVIADLKQSILARGQVNFSGYLDVAPSSNANRQTYSETLGPLVISEEARAKNGVLFKAGLVAAKSVYYNADMAVTAVARAEFEYDTVREMLFPSLTAELPITLGARNELTTIFTPFVTAGFEDAEYSRLKAGVRVRSTLSIAENVQINASASLYESVYRFTPWRDGTTIETAIGSSWSVAPTTLLSVTTRVEHVATDQVDMARTMASIEGRVDHAFDEGLLLGASLELGQRWHNRPPPLSLGPNQQDNFYTVRVEGSHREFSVGPFMPTFYYEFTDQQSDNVFYEYDSHDFGVHLRARL